MQISKHQLGRLTGANKRDGYYELHYETGEVARVYIISDGIFRYWLDPNQEYSDENKFLGDLTASSELFENATAQATSDLFIITSGHYRLIFQQKPALFSIFDEAVHRTRVAQLLPLELSNTSTLETLKQSQKEYYFGCGVQNGHFSHKGTILKIKTDGVTGKDGVLAGIPFFWSNAGFAEIRNTTAPGQYDFGKYSPESTCLKHSDPVFDNIYIIGNSPQEILNKYYSLTGHPNMIPKFALSLGHLGNFIDTKWTPAKDKEREAIKFEDGSYYISKRDGMYSASLNGEDKYQFSARAMIDRYKRWKFPLGWITPNYESESSVDQNKLELFNEYALNHDVQPGYWTKKADFTLPKGSRLVADDTDQLRYASNELKSKNPKQKPLVLTKETNTAIQENSALAFGDIGGDWDNLKTQISTLLGTGLSGIPIAGASVDGKEGGGNAQVALRDLEWKVFTPLLFLINNQSQFSKTPFAYNNKISRIARSYLNLREKLKPYLYSLIREVMDGDLIMRPLFMEFPHDQTSYTDRFGDEFMLGSQLLVAPITNGRTNNKGESLRDHLYLPDKQTVWIDLFDGSRLMGGRVYNKLHYPLWHLPVFVRGGSIFDLGDRNFVLYPQGESSITFYDDNDQSDYAHNWATTTIHQKVHESSLRILVKPTEGYFENLQIKQGTILNINCDQHPGVIQLTVDNHTEKLEEYGSLETLAHAKEGFYYDNNFSWLSDFVELGAPKHPALIIKLAERDIKQSKLELLITNFVFAKEQLIHQITDSALQLPTRFDVDPKKISSRSLTVKWQQRTPYVQLEVNGMLYTGITGNLFTLNELTPNTSYTLRLRYESGYKVSEWSRPITVKTKPDPNDFAIYGIRVSSNTPSKDAYPLKNILDKRISTQWQTIEPAEADRPVTLFFEFEQEQLLSKMVYVPNNLYKDGRPLKMSIEVSGDGKEFEKYGEVYSFNSDSKNKVIGLRNVHAKAIKLNILESTGDFVSASDITFYHAQE